MYQVHIVANFLADGVDGFDLSLEVPRALAAASAMDLENGIAHIPTLGGEFGEVCRGL